MSNKYRPAFILALEKNMNLGQSKEKCRSGRSSKAIICWGYWDISVMPSIESYLTLLMTLFMTQFHES
jgi:hypothetical protein